MMAQAGKQLFLVGNWKSHKNYAEAMAFMDQVRPPLNAANIMPIICPPFPYIYPMSTLVKDRQIQINLGVQDISPFPFGAYTGAIAPLMLPENCEYVIVGHSERRKYFHETNEDVALKVRNALDANLTPIVCIDEPYLEAQLAFFTQEEMAKLIVAYEPLAAIGSGQPDTPDHANQIALKIRSLYNDTLPILYGGSVTAETVASFVTQPDLSGVLVGGASLDPFVWNELLKNANGIS